MNLDNYTKHRPYNLYALFASERAVKILLGDKVSHFALAVIVSTCYADKELQRLAGMYLVGSSERAEQNLANLDALIVKTFQTNTEN